MSANLVKRTPYQWAYTKMQHGQHINTLHLVSMMKSHHQQDKLNLLRQLCQLSGKVAISSRMITKRQCMKYAQNRLKDGKASFYLFDKNQCPADVGSRIDWTGGPVYI